MKTRLTLKPGQDGTKHELEKYGDTLVCIRFRYDVKTGIRLKRKYEGVRATRYTKRKYEGVRATRYTK